MHRIQNKSQNYTEIQILKEFKSCRCVVLLPPLPNGCPAMPGKSRVVEHTGCLPRAHGSHSSPNPSPGDPTPSSGVYKHQHTCGADTHADEHSHTRGWGEGSMVKSVHPLTEDLSSVASTHIRWLTTDYNSNSRVSEVLFWLSWAHTHTEHTLTWTHTHIYK